MIYLVAVVKGLGLPVHLRRVRWGDRLTCNRCPRPLPRLCLQCCTCVRGLFRGCHLRPLGGSRAVVERSFWNTSWTWTCSSKVWWSRACLPQRWSLCSILALDEPFCGFCTCRLFQRKNKPGTCRSWNTWGIGTGIHIWETACKCCTLPRVWLILQPQTCEGQATTPCSAALVSSTRESWQPITREHKVVKNLPCSSRFCHLHWNFVRYLFHFWFVALDTSIKFLSPVAFSKQLLTDGSTLEPPKAANSPNTLGIWMQSWRRRPSFLSVALRCWSAIRRNMSTINILLFMQSLNTY